MTTLEDTAAPNERSGVLIVLLAGVIWSTVGLGIRLIEEATVWQILFYRSFGLTLLLYIVIHLRTGRSAFTMIAQLGWPGLIGAWALLGAYTGGIIALQTTTVANVMLIFASAPFMAAILGLLILGEAVRWQTWLSIAVALIGIGLMMGGKFGEGAFWGNLAALGAAFGFAAFTIALRWGRSGEMLPCVFLSGLLAIPVMGGICLVLGLPFVLNANDANISLGMGLFQVGAGLVLYTIGSKSVPAAQLTLLSMSEVVLAPVWVWLVLDEVPAAQTLLGGAVLLGAVMFNALSGARRRWPTPHT
jgi:drug/metabolite transporter (DMT)-like permease